MAGITGRTATGYGYPYGSYAGAPGQPMGGYQAGYGWPMQQAGMMQQAAPAGMMQQATPAAQMSKPTVHADIIQIENEAAAESEPVDAGTSQMMITKDEGAILVKSVLANGETTIDIYRKIPPKAKPAGPEYVTREEFETRMAEIARAEKKPRLRVLENEEEDDEPEGEGAKRTRSTNGGPKK